MALVNGSLYYAHAMPIYRTPAEKAEVAQIQKQFKGYTVVNPAAYDGHPEKRKDTMAFCFKLIDPCNPLVFSKWQGVITSGVGQEVNYALDMQPNYSKEIN